MGRLYEASGNSVGGELAGHHRFAIHDFKKTKQIFFSSLRDPDKRALI